MTPKQERFVEEYLIDLNGTQAAIRAGYSPATANEQASRMLAKVNIQEAVAEAKKQRSERTNIDADWLLTRLAQEADADLAELYSDSGALLPVSEWPMIWRTGLVSGLDVTEEKGEGGAKVGEVTKIKLSERIKRLELIGRHVSVQAFKEQVEHTGNVTVGGFLDAID